MNSFKTVIATAVFALSTGVVLAQTAAPAAAHRHANGGTCRRSNNLRPLLWRRKPP